MPDRNPSPLARAARPEPPPPWGAGAAVVTTLAAFAIVFAVSIAVLSWLGLRPATPLIAVTLGGLAIIAFVLQTRRRPEERAALRLDRLGASLPLLLAANAIAALALDALAPLLSGQFLPPPELIALTQAPNDAFTWLVAALFMVVVQPLAEEMVFRGVALPVLRTSLGVWPGAAASALLSGLYHLALYPPTYPAATTDASLLYGLIVPFLQGLIFAVNRVATGSTRAAIVAHAVFGLFALLDVALFSR